MEQHCRTEETGKSQEFHPSNSTRLRMIETCRLKKSVRKLGGSMEHNRIALIASLDTKLQETLYAKHEIESCGGQGLMN